MSMNDICGLFVVDTDQLAAETEHITACSYVKPHSELKLGATTASVSAKLLAWAVQYMQSCYADFAPAGFEFLSCEALLLVGKAQQKEVAGLFNFAILATESESRLVVAMAQPVVGAFAQLEPKGVVIVSDTVAVKLAARSVLYPDRARSMLNSDDPVLMRFNELITVADINLGLVPNRPEIRYAPIEILPTAQNKFVYAADNVFNTAEEFNIKMTRLRQRILAKGGAQTVVFRYPATEVLGKLAMLERFDMSYKFETHKAQFTAKCEVYSYNELIVVAIEQSLHAYDTPHLILSGLRVTDCSYEPLYLNVQDRMGMIVTAEEYAKTQPAIKDKIGRLCLRRLVAADTHLIGLLHKHNEVDEDLPETECVEMVLAGASKIET